MFPPVVTDLWTSSQDGRTDKAIQHKHSSILILYKLSSKTLPNL